MSFSEEIEPPYVLASLPHPVDSVHGRTLATGVSSLHGLKKRKRFEVAVGVDGEGINIYNVQNPRLIASYAVPPHAYFCTPPCSVYQKASKDQPARRYTYASIVHSQPTKSNAQVICFREDINPATVGDAEKFTYDIASRQNEVAAIETAGPNAANEGEAHEVIIVYKNGVVECLSSDLQTSKWTSDLNSLLPGSSSSKRGSTQVEYASITSGDVVSRSFLKERDDILLRSKSSQWAAMPVLCLVTRTAVDGSSGSARHLHLLGLRASSPSVTTQQSGIRHLTAWELPVPADVSSNAETALQYSLHSVTGTLQQLGPDAITSFDFTHPSPTVSVFRPQQGSFKSFTRLSSSLSLAIASGFLGIYDVRYSALQGALSYQPAKDNTKEAKKRKRSSFIDASDDLSLVSYLSEIGLVVGLAGNDLVAIQLSERFYSKKQQRRAGLLIDSIGKGVSTSQPTLKSDSAPASLAPFSQLVASTADAGDGWRDKLTVMNEFADKKDVFNFERVFAEAAGIQRDTASYEAWEKSTQMTNGTDKAAPGTEGAPLPPFVLSTEMTEAERLLNRPKALYALSKIFDWASTTSQPADSPKAATSITIKFLPPNVFEWLLRSRYLSKDLIERALHQGMVSDQIKSVQDGDIVTSIFNHENKMRLLYYILDSKAYLDICEIVQAIKLIVQSLDTMPMTQLTSHLLTNGDAEEATKDMEAYLDEAVEAATNAIDQAYDTLEHGVVLRGHTLRSALTKLHSFPAPRIVEALRARLSHHELIFLIQLLRIELAEGGWASRYFVDSDPREGSSMEDPSDRAIGIIALLLSCVLDAIGVSGWLTAAANSSLGEDAPDDVVHLLRQEISAALEGVHEATFMKGLLGEYLRFCHRDANTAKIPDHVRSRLMEKPFLVPKQDHEYDTLQRRIVPLGLRPIDAAQEKWRRDISGQWVLRSKREIGQAISRQVPKYSIEKIRI